MGGLFYELYDAYQQAQKEAGHESMPEALVQKCRLAAEVQHAFLNCEARHQGCLDKLLGFLYTDCIPVRCCCCPCCGAAAAAVAAAVLPKSMRTC